MQYLGASPIYRLLIRDKVFLNPAAEPLSRASAATALSRTDPSFATYALIVALEPNIAAQVFATTIRGYVSQMMAQNKLDAPARFLLRDVILNYKKNVRNEEQRKIIDETLELLEL